MHRSILVAGDASSYIVFSGINHHPHEPERFCLSVAGGVHLLYALLRAGLQSSRKTKPELVALPQYPSEDPRLSSHETVTALELVRRARTGQKNGTLGLKSVLGRYPAVKPHRLPSPKLDPTPSLLVLCHLDDRDAPWWKDLKPSDGGMSVIFTCHPSKINASWGCFSRQRQRRRVLAAVPAEALRASGCLINPLSWEGALIDLYRNARSAKPSPVMTSLASVDDLVITLGAYAAIYGRFPGGASPEERVANCQFSLIACLDEAYMSHEAMLTNAGFAGLQAAGIAAHVISEWDPADSAAGDLPKAISKGVSYCDRHINVGFNPRGPDKTPSNGIDASEAWCQTIAGSGTPVTAEQYTVQPVPKPRVLPEMNWSLLKQACGEVSIEGRLNTNSSAFLKVLRSLADPQTRGAAQLAMCLNFPMARFGDWVGVERSEIESYQSLKQRIARYLGERSARPLCLAAFGPPGAGKSFGIKQLAKGLATEEMNIDPDVLEYNLAEFTDTHGLIRALHRARDRTLGGKVPLVLLDEFDSNMEGRPLGWLKYLLAPMWDGNFRDGDFQYHTGQAILVFVGGTRRTFAEFSAQLRNRDFIDAKGPDFVSRLSGHVNVRGVNKVDEHDELYFVRRAVFLAGKLHGAVEDQVLRALLTIPSFRHGSRSLESLIKMCVPEGGRITRSSLPPEHQLDMHVDATLFHRLLAS